MLKGIALLFLSIFIGAGTILSQESIVLVQESATKRVLVPTSYVSANWRRSLAFDESGWRNCTGAPGGVGYEKGSGYENLITLDVGDEMHDDGGAPNPSCYIRIKFFLTAADLNGIKFLHLNMRADDGFIAYLNGTKIAEQNAPQNPQWNSAATANQEAADPVSYGLSSFIDRLVAGENLLAIHGLNDGTDSSDFLITTELVGIMGEFGNFESSNLPLVLINTFGQSIPNDTRIIAEMGIINNPDGRNAPNDPFNDYNGRISIEVRGSTSAGFPKQQYAFETQDSLGNNLNVPLMGLPQENDWILHAPYSDKSLMRNVLIYKLARDLGWYASRTRYCEFFLNGDYRGVYILMEKIKRDKNRVDIARLKLTDTAGDSLTGGYIFKIDKEPWKPGWESQYRPFPGSNKIIKYQYHYPKADEITAEQKAYIKGFMDEFEDVMAGDNFDDPAAGFVKYIDVNSFVDFFILNEIPKNVDGYRLSTFMYKDRDDNGGKLTMGPIWDFNLGFGNANYKDGWNTETLIVDFLTTDPGHMNGDTWQVPFYWQRLLSSSEFTKRIYKRWIELRGNKLSTERIFAIMDSLHAHIKEGRVRNFDRWQILGQHIWPNVFVGDTYEEEFEWMKNWTSERMSWMDGAIDIYRTDVKRSIETTAPHSIILHQNYPNPFNPTTTITFELPAALHVTLEIYNTKGQIVNNLSSKRYAPGAHRVVWNGLDRNGQKQASGVYIYRLFFTHDESKYDVSRRMILLR